jgi:phospholipase/carboxylesterase
MALSAFLPLASTLAAEASAANRDVPIFIAHGLHDTLIPAARARRGREVLQALGYQVDFREYPMPHAVCGEEVADIGAWLRHVLSPKERT